MQMDGGYWSNSIGQRRLERCMQMDRGDERCKWKETAGGEGQGRQAGAHCLEEKGLCKGTGDLGFDFRRV